MGQLDQTVLTSLRERICTALKQAEAADTNSVRAQTLRLIKCAMNDRDVTARVTERGITHLVGEHCLDGCRLHFLGRVHLGRSHRCNRRCRCHATDLPVWRQRRLRYSGSH